jgi:hypothetical protein
VTVHRWFWPFVVGCLVLQALLAVDCARQWTPTHDEFWHLPIGLRMWKSGRFDDDVINPPPVRLWAAIPLVLAGADPGVTESRPDVGQIGDAFWKAGGDRIRLWFLLGRLMIIPLMSLTGVAVVLWSRAWYGERAALASVLLWTCCPTILANAAIVTHDLPLAAAWTLTLLALVRFAERPSWQRASLFGVMLGIAPLAKLTGLILLPLSVALWFVLRFRIDRTVGVDAKASGAVGAMASVGVGTRASGPDDGHDGPIRLSRGRVLVRWLAALAVSLMVLNAGYLFRGTGTSLGSLNPASPRLQAVQRAASGIGGLPVPLPREFIGALDRLAQDLESQHPVFLDGTWSDHPILVYYAAALCYKLPLATLVLFLVALVGLAWPRPDSQDRRHGLFLLMAALVLPILASGSPNQIGIRYVLPTLPVLCVFASQSARWLMGSSRRWVSYLVWGALLAAPLSLRFHPHHLAYFNAIAGGPARGSQHLVDSNIDWGQDLHALKGYLGEHKVEDVGLAYFGTVVPANVGIKSHRPPTGFPQPGWYAISVSFVQGRPHALRDSNGDRTPSGIDEFGYFRFFEPVARIGYSINVYELTPQDIDRFALALQRAQRASR